MSRISRLGAAATATAVALLVGAVGVAQASPPTAASGSFTQTAITGFELRLAGPNTIIESTTEASVSGTLTGSAVFDLRLVIHPNGVFTAKSTITCECTAAGRSGTLALVTVNRGREVSPDPPAFEGSAVITGGTGELAGLRGVLEIEGTVDPATNLSTIDYSGQIHFHP